MEKCKFCQGELEENTTLCPHCGKDNAQLPEEPEAPVAPVTENTEETPQQETTITEEETSGKEAQEESAPAEEKTPVVEGKKASPALIAVAVAAVVVLLAALTALVLMGLKDRQNREDTQVTETAAATEETVVATIPADGDPDDVTCKGSYTGTDADALAAADTVVATMGDHTLTNRELQVYYWQLLNQQAYQFAMYGYLDPYQGLDTQIFSQTEEKTLTWQHAFLQSALNSWQQEQAMAAVAETMGLELSEETAAELEALPQVLEEQAVGDEYADAQAMIADILGVNATLEDYVTFCQRNAMANAYYDDLTASLVPTQEELEAYYAENEELFVQSGVSKQIQYMDVRHILLSVEGTTDENGTTTYSDEDWEACRAKAQEILDTWLAGEKTEESFAALANAHSTDGGSNTNGGLYEKVYVGQMVTEFNDWCFDESRQPGDYGLVKTTYGYHIMYFVRSYVEENPDWQAYTENQWVSEQASNKMSELVAANPMTVDYSAIVLGNIDLVG